MTAKAVGVDLNLKLTNLMAGEHLKPEFLKVSCVELFYQSWTIIYAAVACHELNV